MHEPACRACGTPLRHTFADLGSTPLANRYLSPADMHRMEPWYPLHARVCEACKLVQLEAFESPEAIFGDYAYLSSFSDSWLAHCRRHAGKAGALRRWPAALGHLQPGGTPSARTFETQPPARKGHF